MSDPNSTAGPRLSYLPISLFAVVMGLTGLTIAWEKAQLVFGRDLGVTPWFAGISAGVFVLLLLLYLIKLAFFSQSVVGELRHPVKLNFFPTISISLLLLSVAFMPIDQRISLPLWYAGAGLHLLFTLYVVNVWMHRTHFEVQHMNPAWFIPAVGNVIVPIAGVPLGQPDLSWFFFSIGMMFWGILLTIIFYRVLFHHPIDARLMPTLFILIAPPAVGFIAYMRLTGELDAFARVLYYIGLFLTLLLFTQVRRFARLEFFISWWAYSFPLAAISIATLLMSEVSGNPIFRWIGGGLVVILTAVVSLLIVRTLDAVFRHRICVPGH